MGRDRIAAAVAFAIWFALTLLVWFLLGIAALLTPANAQSFDRLEMRPRSLGGGSYEPGKISFCASVSWPTSDPECVTLSALEVVERYDLALPVAGPNALACLLVDATGQMYFEDTQSPTACRQGTAFLPMKTATYGSQVSGSGTYEFNRGRAVLAGAVDPHWLEGWSASGGALLMWTFRAPPGLQSPATLSIWWFGSSSFGSDPQNFGLSCTTPNEGTGYGITVFDTANATTFTPAAAGRIHRDTITLTNDSGMAPDDICTLYASQQSTGNLSFILNLEIN